MTYLQLTKNILKIESGLPWYVELCLELKNSKTSDMVIWQEDNAKRTRERIWWENDKLT